MAKRARVKPTKMWGRAVAERYAYVSAISQCGCSVCGYHPVIVLGYRDYLALKRAAKGVRRGK